MSQMNGKFVVIEGGEGSGKSTLCARLALHFGEKAVLTREPGGVPFSEGARGLLFSEAGKDASVRSQLLLMYAARYEHVRTLIRPQRQNGKVVISDRFHFSSCAYQVFGSGTKSRTEDLHFFWCLHHFCVPREDMPDMVIVLDIDPALGLARVHQRAGELSHFDARELDFHTRVREGYLYMAEMSPHSIPEMKVVRIDASASADAVFAHALAAIEAL